ncbi:MAG: efflux RND transporter periplasmic adaptor subunit [Bacteroidia bacterium]|nr:efflux RND transporter periplasmic adaptor subunit [Bacteroidia bacterium]
MTEHHTPSPSTPSRRKYYYYALPILILGAGFVLMQVLAGMKEEPPRRPPAKMVKPVDATVIRLSAMAVEIEALGRVVSSQPVQLISEVSGLAETGDVPFKPAQRFRRGQVLLRIDDRQAELNLNSSKSDFLNALASVLPELKVDFPEEYETWQRYFDRCAFYSMLEELPEPASRNVKLLLTRAQVYKLFYTTKNLEITLEKHRIRAPFDGSIVSTTLRPGSSTRSGSPVGEIISLENMEIELPIPASELPWLKSDAEVFLRSGEDRIWSGRVARIGTSVDKRTQTVPVFVSVSTPAGLIEGMYVSARIPGKGLEAAVRVPRRAVYDNRYVYLVHDGALVRREVDLINSGAQSVLVNRGLSDGDTLVTELMQGVAPGMPVQAKFSGEEAGGQ